MHFRPRFWAFRNFLGLLRFLWNLWVGVYEIAITCSCIAYSLHYNYVSCILGECAWLLMWVLIGLDWVFPMMLLIFARHMFMQTFFLFFPIRSICRVSFYSLSLSLSWIDCVTAPKQRKSILSRNPLQGFGSSSSSIPPIPSHFRFRDEKAKTDFFENFQACGVHPER